LDFAVFERFMRDGRFRGYLWSDARWTFFFGSRFTSKADLPAFFPNFDFHFVHQVHGSAVVPAAPQGTAQADAHFSSVPGAAVVVQSADCVPLLLAGQNQVCAVHSGWRGVAKNIVQSVHQTLPQFQPEIIAIGPHIGLPSFEVELAVAEQILSAQPADTPRPALNAKKVHLHLLSVVQAQLAHEFQRPYRLLECCPDTKTSPEFHSYRRDKTAGGRQFSFVVLNP
jgi:YfiH family protein